MDGICIFSGTIGGVIASEPFGLDMRCVSQPSVRSIPVTFDRNLTAVTLKGS